MPPPCSLPLQPVRPAWSAAKLCRTRAAPPRLGARLFATAPGGADTPDGNAGDSKGAAAGVSPDGSPNDSAGKQDGPRRPKTLHNTRLFTRDPLRPPPIRDDKSKGKAKNLAHKRQRETEARNRRLDKLLKPQIPKTKDRAQAEMGPRKGIITKYTILDDAAWQKVKTAGGGGGGTSRTISRKIQEKMRSAIQDVQSALEADREEDAGSSRYRQDTPKELESPQEQRLRELEELLAMAHRRLQELKGDDAAREKRERPSGRQGTTPVRRKRSESHATAEFRGSSDSSTPDGNLNPPVRYLSRDPSAPLPHTTGQVIPGAILGSLAGSARPRQGSVEGANKPEAKKPDMREAQDSKVSLADELFPSIPKKSKSSSGRNQKHGPLLKELFPELEDEAARRTGRAQKEREIPKLSLDLQAQEPTPQLPPKMTRKQLVTQRMARQMQEEVAIVRMSGLSKNLSEEDIKRLLPASSKHIEGWTDPDFIKVLPMRDNVTLERTGEHYAFFRSMRAARDFQDNFKRIELIIQTHVPASSTSLLPPPPGFTDEKGHDIHAIFQSFTVGRVPRGGAHVTIVPSPYSYKLRSLIYGGYESFIEPLLPAGVPSFLKQQPRQDGDAHVPTTTTTTRVLFHVEGPQPSLLDVRRTIARDGKDRGLAWRVVGGTNGPQGVVKLNPTLSRDQAGSDDAEDLAVSRKMAPRYVVSFENKAEALRFVARWHCREFDWRLHGPYENGEGAPRASVEVLW